MNAEVQEAAEPKLYLLDIEGTVAPISFVTEQLFPYAQKHFAAFLRPRLGEPDIQADLALLAKENHADYEPGHPEYAGLNSDPGGAAALNYLLWQMDRDRKSTALKSLQGKIWKAGFESGRLENPCSSPMCRAALAARVCTLARRHLLIGIGRGAAVVLPAQHLWRSHAAHLQLLRHPHRAQDGDRQLCGDLHCHAGCNPGNDLLQRCSRRAGRRLARPTATPAS